MELWEATRREQAADALMLRAQLAAIKRIELATGTGTDRDPADALVPLRTLAAVRPSLACVRKRRVYLNFPQTCNRGLR